MARRGKGLACGDAGTTWPSHSHCSQLEQTCIPVPDPSWGRDLQTVTQQGPRDRDSALPAGGGTEMCPYGSSCATHRCTVFTGLSAGDARQNDPPQCPQQ